MEYKGKRFELGSRFLCNKFKTKHKVIGRIKRGDQYYYSVEEEMSGLRGMVLGFYLETIYTQL